jgi:hypothetical protein
MPGDLRNDRLQHCCVHRGAINADAELDASHDRSAHARTKHTGAIYSEALDGFSDLGGSDDRQVTHAVYPISHHPQPHPNPNPNPSTTGAAATLARSLPLFMAVHFPARFCPRCSLSVERACNIWQYMFSAYPTERLQSD